MPRKANGEGSVYQLKRGDKTVWVAQLVVTDPRTLIAQRFTAQRKTEPEARKALQNLRLKAISARPPRPRDARTVAEAMEAYLADLAHRVGPTTVATYRTIVENHIIPHLGNRRAQSITRADVVVWMTEMRDPSDPDVAPVGDRTIQVAYQRLKSVIAADVAHLRPEEHPFPARGGPRVAEPEIAFWDASEVRRFLGGLKDDPHEALMMVVLSTGLRQGEALGLFWGDRDPSGRILRVARSRSRSDGRPTKSPKTASGRREVHLASQAVEALNRHREKQIARDHGVGPADPIFTGPKGGPLSAPAAYHGLQRIIDRLGLKRISFHALRHTAATHMLESGANIRVIQSVLGHADPNLLLKRYAHVLPGSQAVAAAAMEAVFDGPQEPAKASDSSPEVG